YRHILAVLSSAESCNKCLDQTNSMRVVKCRLEISSSARLLQKYTFLAKMDGTAELYRGKCKDIKGRIPFSSSVIP
uniref:Uncharacterized protein n=1 Tax=Taeniopygia guttata TaxID=59729 RepID=A0A674HJR8_TAEGU